MKSNVLNLILALQFINSLTDGRLEEPPLLPATPIAFYLKSLAKSELGVTKVNTLLDKSLVNARKPSKELVEAVFRNLEQKWTNFTHHLEDLALKLEIGSLETPSTISPAKLPPCCSTHPDSRKGCSVMHLGSNATHIASLTSHVFDAHPPPMGGHGRFFISTDNAAHFEFPARRACGQAAYTWHRPNFVQAIKPSAKNTIIVLDRGVALSNLQLDVGRAIADYIISSLSFKDKLAMLTLDAHITSAPNQACEAWAPATTMTKRVLLSFLQSMNRMSYQRYDHSMALHRVDKLIQQVPSAGEEVHLFFITTAKSVKSQSSFLRTFQELQEKAKLTVKMQLFLMDGAKDQALMKGFQDKIKSSELQIMVNNVDSTLLLSYKIGSIFKEEEATMTNKSVELSLPWIGFESSPVLTITTKLSSQAILGLDIDYTYLFSDFLYKDLLDQDSYFCILDISTQTVIYHPKLYITADKRHEMFPQGWTLDYLEPEILPDIVADLYSQELGSSKIGPRKFCRWKRLGQVFIVLLIERTMQSGNPRPAAPPMALPLHLPDSGLLTTQESVVFHSNLTTEHQTKLCRHLHYPATLEKGSVYLSPTAFQNPNEYTHSLSNISKVMEYLTFNETNVNPGLHPNIRDDLLFLSSSILPIWKAKSFTSGMNNYIVRRFTYSNGLFLAYPGSPLPKSLAPANQQEWYLTARRFPNKVVLGRPRLDYGGAGFVSTLSQFVSGSATDSEGIAMGMDITSGFIYKMLLDTLPMCANLKNNGVRCFIFDHEGYIIVHPAAQSSSHHQNNLHLTHVEHLFFNMIIEDEKSLVQRKTCTQYSDMTLLRYYQFNTTSAASHTTWKNDNLDCLQYKVARLPETNLFLGMIIESNATSCAVREEVTFCPCNRAGKQCMLCQDNDEYTCECPCSCPLMQCQQPSENDVPPACPFQPLQEDHVEFEQSTFSTFLNSLPPCFDTNCQRHSSQDKCAGVIGCSWCTLEAETQSPLESPFCSEEDKCFGGFLGAPTPYLDHRSVDSTDDGDQYFFRPTPSIAPIIGSILSLILFLGFSAYCLRNYNKCLCLTDQGRLVNRRTVASRSSILQAASFEEVLEEDNEGDKEELHELGPHTNSIVPSEASSVVSPYRINPGYRRPPCADSDHGYSTMTPMGGDLDSEIVPYVDSLSARHRLQRLQQRQAVPSVTSGISSRTSSPTPISAKKGLLVTSSSSEESPMTRGVTNHSGGAPHEIISLKSESEASFKNQPKPAKTNQFVVAATVHMVDT